MSEPEKLIINEQEALAAVDLAFDTFGEDRRELSEYLVGRPGRSTSADEWARAHLITRSVADAHAGMNLLNDGWVAQGYSVLRPICESLNLVRLFEQEPEWARTWAEGNHRELTPLKVRQRLELGPDEIYKMMCGHSHPQFQGAQVSSYMRLTDETRTAVMLLGPVPRYMPPVLLAITWPSHMLGLIAFACTWLPNQQPEDEAALDIAQRILDRSEPVKTARNRVLWPDGLPGALSELVAADEAVRSDD